MNYRNALKHVLGFGLGLLLACSVSFGQQTTYTGISIHGPFTNTTSAPSGLAQMLGPNFELPFVTAGSTGYIKYTAGTIYPDGHTAGGIYIAASAAAGVALDASKNSCVYPAFTTCDIAYANSSGTVAVTTSIATAKAAGDTVLAYIETNASKVPTKITYPYQLTVAMPPFNLATDVIGNLPATNGGPSISDCGTSATCAAPTSPTTGIIVTVGHVAMSAATSVTVTGMPTFTSATSFNCSASDPTHATYAWMVTNVSTTSITITSGTSNSDTWTYSCVGY